MVRPTRDARAHDRSRGGKLSFVLSLTVSHAFGMPSPLRYLPRMGAVSLRRGLVQVALKQHDEKIRELVMALVGQEPGDEPRRPRTPLLAPFITHDVLLRVNNSLMPPNNAERGGLGLQAALGRAVAALTGAPRRRAWRTPGTRGNAMQARARRTVYAL